MKTKNSKLDKKKKIYFIVVSVVVPVSCFWRFLVLSYRLTNSITVCMQHRFYILHQGLQMMLLECKQVTAARIYLRLQ